MTHEEHPNATRVRGLFDSFRQGDVDEILRRIPEDCTWRFPGRSNLIAGTHEGRDAILRFLAAVGSLTDGTFHLELHDVIANDDWAIALFTGSARRGTKVLDNPTCLRIRLDDGEIREIWEFVWDLHAVEDFWT